MFIGHYWNQLCRKAGRSVAAPLGLVHRRAAARRHLVPAAPPRTALIVGGAVFSHWVLDFLVHRPDLPLYDNTAKVDLGLLNLPAIALSVEALLLFGGMWLYFRTSAAGRTATVAFGVIMLAIQASVFFGPPPTSDKAAAGMAIVGYALFAGIIAWVERGRGRTVAA